MPSTGYDVRSGGYCRADLVTDTGFKVPSTLVPTILHGRKRSIGDVNPQLGRNQGSSHLFDKLPLIAGNDISLSYIQYKN